MQQGNITNENSVLLGRIHSIESFGTLDGPGIRTVVFFQGCPLRCKFCHNPDCVTMSDKNLFTVDQLTARVIKNRPYWKEDPAGKTSGGVTLSGGEPLMQAEFAMEFLRNLKNQGINTAVDTCLYTNPATILGILEYVDLWMVSVKHLNDADHKELTGISNSRIMDNIQFLDSALSTNILRIRYLVIPTITDSKEYQDRFLSFLKSLKHLETVEILAYGTHGKQKWIELTGSYPLEGIPEASKERIKKIADYFVDQGIPVKYS